jgi:soluble lytic murein transglycosylase-like protein
MQPVGNLTVPAAVLQELGFFPWLAETCAMHRNRFLRFPSVLVLLLGCFAALGPAQAAGIVKWIDANGVTHYSNVPTDRARASATPVSTAPSEAPRGSRASVFKFRDANGVTHYTDRRPQNRRYTVINVYCPACDPRSPVNWDRTRLNTTAYDREIAAAAERWKVDPALVRAVIHAESAFRPDALSRKGAQGLMQLMPGTADMYGVSDPFDAAQNIDAGVQHLAGLLTRYKGDVQLAAAAYNAGEGAVQRHGGIPPFEETKYYVQRVGILHKRYQSGS